MANNFNQPGDVIDYTAQANHASGALVIIGTLAAVTLGAINNGATGSVAISGVWTLPKASNFVAAQGATVYEDGGLITTTASGNPAVGTLVAATGAGNTTCRVKLNVVMPAPAS